MAEQVDVQEWKPSSLNEVSVMVVDDDPLITRLVTGALKAIGITKVYPMNDPHQALDFIAEGLRGTDMILCDLMMPDVDGLTILGEVRKIKPDLPFLMLTADGTSDSVRRAVELGVSSYMIKPFTIDDLQSKVLKTIIRTYGAEAGNCAKDDGNRPQETSWT
ncbi:MAG: response regulator [Rhodospirillales bacterium]|nr:response regulator [Rhodospirillales bacterium]